MAGEDSPMTGTYSFDNVTLLITHYNRSASLERLLRAFRELNCGFGDIVVSDDGSKPVHIQTIQALRHTYPFRLVTTPVNKGLGNNINKGQDAVTTPYTLYVQEDFVPTAIFPAHFRDALDMMKQEKDIDVIRFYAYFPYPYKKPYKKGYSEIFFHKAPWYGNHLKFYFYSDHPHLRRSNFFDKFGRYAEGQSGDQTEYRMSLSFIHHKARGLVFDAFTTLFHQVNSADEPSTMNRSDWKQSPNVLVRFARYLYLKAKFARWTLDVLTGKYVRKQP
ncbi:MAG: glycosyltransferase [Chitinophagaceae bacterium]